MSRGMAADDFRRDRWERRYAPNVRDLNQYVDRLNEHHEAVPYIDPDSGGRDAEVLFLLQDPGPKAGGPEGSGFLSVENDDDTAATMCALLDEVGLPWQQCVPWNVVPWYVAGNLTTLDKREGVESLHDFLALLPNLRVVVLMGGEAHKAWARLLRRYPRAGDGIVKRETLHTAGRGITNGSRHTRDVGIAKVRTTLAEVVALLGQ